MSDELSYYERNKEARKAYQREYYKRVSYALKRKKELEALFAPEKVEARRKYQREYYLKNRATLLAARRARYAQQRDLAKAAKG